MIGWENDRGAYFIQKLKNEIDNLSDALEDTNEDIGTLSNLTTTAKTNVVSAINEVDVNCDTNTASIGTLTDLKTTSKTNIVSAINEVDDFVPKTYSVGKNDSMTFVKPAGIVLVWIVREASSTASDLFIIDNWNSVIHMIGNTASISVTISGTTVTIANTASLAVGVMIQYGINIV